MVQNGVPRVCFYFCSMVQNSEHFSPLWNGSERNSDIFLFRGTDGIPPEQTNCSVFRGIIFWSEIATLRQTLLSLSYATWMYTEYLFIYLLIYLFLFIYFIYFFLFLFIFIYLFIYLFIFYFLYLFILFFIFLFICKVIYDKRPPHIWGNISAFPHILESPSSYMTLQLLHSEFSYKWGKFDLLFYQCRKEHQGPDMDWPKDEVSLIWYDRRKEEIFCLAQHTYFLDRSWVSSSLHLVHLPEVSKMSTL